jgi:hypothetical protein
MLVNWDKEAYFIPIKGTIHQKEKTINLCPPDVNVPNFIKHTLKDFKAHLDSNTVVVGDLIPLCHQLVGHPDKKSTKKS